MRAPSAGLAQYHETAINISEPVVSHDMSSPHTNLVLRCAMRVPTTGCLELRETSMNVFVDGT
jgi:hypothetical protein